MAGNCSVETCGEIFYPSSRQASSNYGIGGDGRIAMYVEECNRSWCSSNASNDQRAVTIEVASTGSSDPWPCSNAALKALIELCYDICKRNNIKKLLWQANKSLVGQVAKQNMTVHRWFSAKACPGDYLYNLHGFIADEVNKKLGVTTSQATCVPGYASNPKNLPVITPESPTIKASAATSTNTTSSVVSSTSVTTSKLVGATNEQKIWNYLKGKGLNDYAIAGVIGNLYAESGLLPNNLQNSYESKLGYTDATYTAAVDNGTYAKFITDSAGYGLAQWTYSTRKSNLLKQAQAQKVSIGDLGIQLDFLWSEMQTYTNLMNTLKSAKTVKAASDSMLLEFEKPANQSESVKNTRSNYGQKYYDKYATKTKTTSSTTTSTASTASSTKSTVPYKVKVIVDVLNVRKTAGASAAVSTTIKKNGIYTITEEKQVTNTDKTVATWGKLKSGIGWINVGSDYVTKVN
jgi:hypothetical protein